MTGFWLLTVSIGVMLAQANHLQELLPAEERVVDGSVEIKAGLRTTIEKEPAYGSRTLEHFRFFQKSFNAGDKTGVDRFLKEGGGVFELPKGTEIVVLENHRPKPPPQRFQSGLTGEQIGRQFQEAALAIGSDKTDYPVETRILNGSLKDQILYLPESTVRPLKQVPIPTTYTHIYGGKKGPRYTVFERPAIDPRVYGGIDHASAMIMIGKEFEKKGRYAEAVGAYWFAMTDDPKFPKASEAADCLYKMGFRKTGPRDYEFDFRRKARSTNRSTRHSSTEQ